MDGSFVIRNRKYHANLSHPNTTMFKTLAVDLEGIIMDIVSLDAEVTSLRNGSIVTNFYFYKYLILRSIKYERHGEN